MSRASRLILSSSAALAFCLLAVSPNAYADDPDPWLGKDKVFHFVAAGAITGVGYAVGSAFTDDRRTRLVIGAACGLVAGAAKEALDAAGMGQPSWRDFAWDAVGTGTGITFAWSIDLALLSASR